MKSHVSWIYFSMSCCSERKPLSVLASPHLEAIETKITRGCQSQGDLSCNPGQMECRYAQ